MSWCRGTLTEGGRDLNKTELVDKVSKESGLNRVQAASAVDAVVSVIQAALKSGDSVSLVGFGTFSISERAARVGRNPRTGQEIQIPASKQPRFKPGKALKDAVG
ncbi:MAG: HU family DNA-binding protein [Magnetococcales bacterium]|nr:HU family DNA-binding protein [Magnetococcales bacterium]